MPEADPVGSWLALTALPGLGPALIQRLLTVFGSPQAVLAAGQAAAQAEGIGPRLTAVFNNPAALAQARSWAAQEQERAVKAGVRLLWCRGDISFLQQPAVALVGSRLATSYGRKVSFLFARPLAEAGFTVISGMADGIDGQAHAGALAAGGRTVAVLGCGVDIVYPRFHSRLYRQILEHGLLISEYPLGTPPEGFRFPARNRIISGLSLGVVVIEAAARSGSLITARMALEQNREVFAVPGRIDSPQSEGAHHLIQQGAHLAHSVEDILAELPMTGRRPEKRDSPPPLPDDLPAAERSVLALLADCPADIEELTAQSGLPVSELHGLLLGLELKGLIRQLPGQQYERC